MENIFFTLIGVDINKDIKSVSSCETDLDTMNEVLSNYDLVSISTNDSTFFVVVDNPFDFADIAAYLNM